MNNKIKIALLLMIASGNQLFSSAGGGGGGADKYGNTHQGRVTTSSAGGGGGGADETVSTTSAATGASNRRSHSHRGSSVAQNQIFGNQYLAENIAQYLSPQEATQGLGLVNKVSHNAAKWRSRFMHGVFSAQSPVLRGHESNVQCVAVLPNGQIASGSFDRTVRVWNLKKRKNENGHVRVLTGHSNGVNSLALLPNSCIVSGSFDGTVRVWDLTKKKNEVDYMEVLSPGGSKVLVTSDERIISAIFEDGTVRIWLSERYFENKVKRTSKREDYLVDGPGVYEILFGIETPITVAEAAVALVQEDDHQGGGADALISAAEAAAALAPRDVVISVIDHENAAVPRDEVDNDADERRQTGCCAQCTAGLRRFFGMN